MTSKHPWLIDSVGLLLLLSLFFGLLLGQAPLAVPDGARYSEIAREMIARHDYLVPHLNGAIYFEKPPLFYWIQVLAIKSIGLNEWALRAPIALFGLLGCLLSYFVAYNCFNRRTAILSSLILASSLLYFIMAHAISIDMALSFFLSLSLSGFLIWTQKQEKIGCLYLAYLAMSAAIMTKGLIGFVFPTIIIGLWIVLTNQWRLILKMHLVRGLLLTALLVLPWHLYLQSHYPFFLDFYLWEQQFLRFSTLIADRYQPAWYYVGVFLGGFYPWWLFLPNPFKQKWSQTLLFLFIWALSIFIFFSLSHSKLIPYILPMFPPIAIFVAQHLDKLFSEKHSSKVRAILLLFCNIASITALAITYQQNTWREAPIIFNLFAGFILLFACMGLLGARALWQARLQKAFGILCLSMMSICLWLVLARPYVDTRPIKSLAAVLNQALAHEPDARVASYDHYYQDLPFYTQREVILVNSLNEFELAQRHNLLPSHFLTTAAFWTLWQKSPRIYMIVDSETFRELVKKHPKAGLSVVAQHERDLLVRKTQ